METDIKDYILWGGGLLLGLVFLYRLYVAWRARRQPGPAQRGGDLNAPPVLTESLSADDLETPLESLMPSTPANPEAAPSTAGDAPGAGQGTRFHIPGRRTEPTVPRKDRAFENGSEPESSESGAAPSEGADGLSDVLVIWVLAKSGASLDGQKLLDVFMSNDLHYDGEVFRKLSPNTGEQWFTVANGVEPGTFDLSNMETLATPRLVLLLHLSVADDPGVVFEDMLEVAQSIAVALDGELKDEHMSGISRQTIEHCRQRIRDYKRKSIRT